MKDLKKGYQTKQNCSYQERRKTHPELKYSVTFVLKVGTIIKDLIERSTQN